MPLTSHVLSLRPRGWQRLGDRAWSTYCLAVQQQSGVRYSSVEEILFARGMIVTYEAIRKWCRQFEQPYANQLRRRSLSLGIRGILTRYF